MKCRCKADWTGKAMAHCATCHETFSTVGNFDKHRAGIKHGDRRRFVGQCVKPDRIGMVQNDRGTWMMTDERDVSDLGSLRGPTSGRA